MSGQAVLTPDCPLCGQPPLLVLGDATQAWCGTENCRTLTWNPSKTVDENLLKVNFVDLAPDGTP